MVISVSFFVYSLSSSLRRSSSAMGRLASAVMVVEEYLGTRNGRYFATASTREPGSSFIRSLPKVLSGASGSVLRYGRMMDLRRSRTFPYLFFVPGLRPDVAGLGEPLTNWPLALRVGDAVFSVRESAFEEDFVMADFVLEDDFAAGLD